MTQKSPNIIKKPISGRDCPCCSQWDNVSLENQINKETYIELTEYQELTKEMCDYLLNLKEGKNDELE